MNPFTGSGTIGANVIKCRGCWWSGSLQSAVRSGAPSMWFAVAMAIRICRRGPYSKSIRTDNCVFCGAGSTKIRLHVYPRAAPDHLASHATWEGGRHNNYSLFGRVGGRKRRSLSLAYLRPRLGSRVREADGNRQLPSGPSRAHEVKIRSRLAPGPTEICGDQSPRIERISWPT
jgi:hypothetical protein